MQEKGYRSPEYIVNEHEAAFVHENRRRFVTFHPMFNNDVTAIACFDLDL